MTGLSVANSALKSLRFMSTSAEDDGDEVSQAVDLTDHDTIPIVPWAYACAGGPSGQWAGQIVMWSWKDFIAKLEPPVYEALFGQ